MYFITRRHLLPQYDGIENSIRNAYLYNMNVDGTLLTTFQMNRLIRKFFRRYDVWSMIEIDIPIDNYQTVVDAIKSESFDQQWTDIKPSNDDYIVHGDTVDMDTTCGICKEKDSCQIRLIVCGCFFHRDCIQTSLKYSEVCPICFSSIYKNKRV